MNFSRVKSRLFQVILVACLISSSYSLNTRELQENTLERVSPDGQVNWYHYCPENPVKEISVNKMDVKYCNSKGCFFEAGRTMYMDFYYTTGAQQHFGLDFSLSLEDSQTNQSFLLHYFSDDTLFKAHSSYKSYLEFGINYTIPSSYSYNFRATLFDPLFEKYELCAEFSVASLYNEEIPIQPTTTTTTTTEATTTKPAIISSTTFEPELPESSTETMTTTKKTSTTFNPPTFKCPGVGTFPDPSSCTLYHICSVLSDGSFWDQPMTCPPQTVFCKESLNCDYEPQCPCSQIIST